MRVAFPRGAKRRQSRARLQRPPTSLRPIPASAAAPFVTPADLAWRVIGLLNLYRLLVPLVLLALQHFAEPGWGLVTAQPRLFVAALRTSPPRCCW